MTSKISFFNIAREDMRRRVWMLALSCLGSFLSLPIAFLLSNTGILNRIDRLSSELTDAELLAEYYANFFRSDALVTVGTVLTAGSIITAIWGFRFLYSRKMVDLYHSIPVKRERLFFVVYLNGLLIWLVPFLVAVGVTLILIFANMTAYGALAYFGSVAGMALRLAGLAIICYLSFYHILLVGVMLSGNAFNALFVTAILSSGVAAIYGMLQLLSSSFLDTFVSAPMTWWHIVWASPLVCPFFLMTDFASTGAGALFIQASASNYDPYWLLRVGNVLVMLFNLLAAFQLYRKRPSELSEHGVDHRRAQSLIRIVVGLAAGLFGSMIFQGILDKDAIAWQVFGILLCGIFAFGVADIILHMNFKSFFAHKKQMGITVAVSCLILFVFAFDLTGFDSRLPDKNRIKSSAIFISNFNDDTYRYQFREDGVMYWNYDYYEERNFENLDALYPLLEQLTESNRSYNEGYATSIDIKLDTVLGPFRRHYRIHQSDLEVLRPIIESEEYLKTFYPASTGQFPTPKELRVDSRISYTECSVTDAKRIQEIMEAYAADFRDNCTIEKLRSGIEVANLHLYYPYEREGSREFRTNSFNLNIYSHYTRTIAKLTEYYPELILEKEKLNIATLQLNAELTLDEIFLFPESVKKLLQMNEGETDDKAKTPAAEAAEITTSAFVLDTKQVVIKEVMTSEISITDPKEIAALLPYLYPGDLSYSPFEDFREYIYLGHAEQANGYTLSCYLKKSDLPLKAPASVVSFITENY